jgi:hypothetical protein
MNRQLPRPYRSFAHLSADIRPPEPGQAYFGYPQPAPSAFPVPQQTPSIFEAPVVEQPRVEQPRTEQPRTGQSPAGQSRAGQSAPWSLEQPPSPSRPKNRRPSHGPRPPARPRNRLHFVGYPLAVILGLLIGVGVAEASGAVGGTTNCHPVQHSRTGPETTGCS